MSKPLSEWTLGEVKTYCEGRTEEKKDSGEVVCCGCVFVSVCYGIPDQWSLSDRITWTDMEIERAKAISILFPGAKEVIETGDYVAIKIDQCVVAYFSRDLFPSLVEGARVMLSDISRALL